MNSIAFWITRLMLVMLFFFTSAVLIIPFFTVFQGFFSQHPILGTVLAILAFAWVLLVLHTANEMASRMVFEDLGFLEALRLSIFEARAALVFVPIIGQWVAPKSEEPDAKRNTPID